MSINAGILGGTGYTGTQLVSILSSHPDVKIKWITSEKFKNLQFHESFPHLKDIVTVECKSISNLGELEKVDIVFSCLPNLTSMHFVKKLFDEGTKIVDLSSDFRFPDIKKFEELFNTEHCSGELNKNAVYGLSEAKRPLIRESQLVANPGCFATSALIPLIPLFENSLTGDEIIFDIKAPVSGAGRAPRLDYHFPETNQNITFDSYDTHTQKSEISEFLSESYGFKKKIVFMVHRIPLDRGILSTIYVRLNSPQSIGEIARLMKEHYSSEKFIRVHEHGKPIALKNVIHSNYCDIGIGLQDDYIIFESAVDNLMKGASGQAVQNMNIMYGLEENTGLDFVPHYP